MSTAVRSIFGPYAQNLQLVVNTAADRFAPQWFTKYFTWAPAQVALTYVSAIGRSRVEAAASVVARNSKTPLRSRMPLEKLNGEIPAMREMFELRESDYRDYLTLQGLTGVDDATKRNQILDMMFGDIKKVADAPMFRLDIMCLQALSEGKISINLTNNPDGIVMNDVDLLMPVENKVNAASTWATAASATPITDINTVINAAQAKGVGFAKMLMSRNLFMKFIKAKEVVDTLTAFYYGPKPGGGLNPVGITTISSVNEYLNAVGFPIIELVDEVRSVEKDGKLQSITPFNQNNVSFVPAGTLGTIKNALALEQLKPVQQISYATQNRVLISKWSQNEPFAEWTKGELNAFPSLEAIDSIFILTAVY